MNRKYFLLWKKESEALRERVAAHATDFAQYGYSIDGEGFDTVLSPCAAPLVLILLRATGYKLPRPLHFLPTLD